MITTLQLHPVNFKSVSCFLCFPGFLKHRLVSLESINRPSTVRQPSVNHPSTARQPSVNIHQPSFSWVPASVISFFSHSTACLNKLL